MNEPRTDKQMDMVGGTYTLPVGPVHVALEEPVYFRLTLDGETVRDVTLTNGHVHRGMEGMATRRNIIKNTTLVERVCSLCSNSHSLTYCMVVENALGIEIPRRAQYLRVIAEEIKRTASHLFNVAIFGHNVGFTSFFIHLMEIREMMQDIKETVYGNRMNLSANCIGGVKTDIDATLAEYIRERLDNVETAAREALNFFSTDTVIGKRARGVGILTTENAKKLGVVGPVARGSGLELDTRRSTRYLVYPELDFELITEKGCDVLSRALVRLREILESIKILRQCLDGMPTGELRCPLPELGNTEAVARTEAPRGELIYYIRTNGSDVPERLKWRVPSYMNWEALRVMMKDCRLADVSVIVNSIDPCVSCTER